MAEAVNTEQLLKGFQGAAEKLADASEHMAKGTEASGKESMGLGGILGGGIKTGFGDMMGAMGGTFAPIKINAVMMMKDNLKKWRLEKKERKIQKNLNDKLEADIKQRKGLTDAEFKLQKEREDIMAVLTANADKQIQLLDKDDPDDKKELDAIHAAIEKAAADATGGARLLGKAARENDKKNSALQVSEFTKAVVGMTAGDQEKEDRQAAADKSNKSLLETMADSSKKTAKGIWGMFKKMGRGGLAFFGIIAAVLISPIVALVAFFKQLAIEFKFLKSFTGKGMKAVGNIFRRLAKFFITDPFGYDFKKFTAATKNSKAGKAIAGAIAAVKNIFTSITRIFSSLTAGLKATKTYTAIGKKIKTTMTFLGKLFGYVKSFFTMLASIGPKIQKMGGIAGKIIGFAKGFGTVLGKIFLPITILMSAFDFITGFMSGYEEGGILGGLEGGLSKMFKGLIGMPLDLLKSAVSWILGMFGWESAEKWLDSFSFSDLIGDIIGGIFSMIGKAVDWIKLLFSDPLAALKSLWTGLLGGFASLIDIVFHPVNMAITWIKKLFGWGEPEKKFSLGDLFISAVNGIIDWFKGLLDIDWSGMVSAIVPSWVKKIPGLGKWLGGGDKKAESTPGDAEEELQRTVDELARKEEALERYNKMSPGDQYRFRRRHNRKVILQRKMKEDAKKQLGIAEGTVDKNLFSKNKIEFDQVKAEIERQKKEGGNLTPLYTALTTLTTDTDIDKGDREKLTKLLLEQNKNNNLTRRGSGQSIQINHGGTSINQRTDNVAPVIANVSAVRSKSILRADL